MRSIILISTTKALTKHQRNKTANRHMIKTTNRQAEVFWEEFTPPFGICRRKGSLMANEWLFCCRIRKIYRFVENLQVCTRTRRGRHARYDFISSSIFLSKVFFLFIILRHSWTNQEIYWKAITKQKIRMRKKQKSEGWGESKKENKSHARISWKEDLNWTEWSLKSERTFIVRLQTCKFSTNL